MHASAECMLYEDTDSTILLRRTQTQRCSHVTHHGLGSRSMREEAFSMEGYHNASLALHRMHQDFSGLPLLSRAQPWQQAARNSPNASTIWWHASTFQTVATSSAKFSERIHVRHVRHATATSTYVVLPAEATSTRLPPAPGQELRRHVPQLQVDSDAADIHSPTSFLPRSIYLRYLFPLTPPSCVYRFLWERTVSIILYTFNSPFLVYSLYLSGGPIPWSK